MWLAQEPIWSETGETKKEMKKWWNLTDFGELFHWLALNTDKQRFVIKYIPFPVG